jgi:MFS transporter, DHA2 family, multidrug resistance protein
VSPSPGTVASFHGNDRLLYGIILGVLTFWLFAQTMLNIGPDMGATLGLDASMMNIAVAATALFSGIFIVVMGGLADHMGRVRTVRAGFYLSIAGSLLVGLARSRASRAHASCPRASLW